jgi:hypothetical protein
MPTLRALHDKMMNEDLDYVLMKSASKITTVTDGTREDKLYNNDQARVFDPGTDAAGQPIKYTKNNIFLQYLKKQQNTNKEYKGSSIFSTQMRKVIEEGLVEGGVPSDFMPDNQNLIARKVLWNSMPNEEKIKYNNYRLYSNYEKAISNLTAVKKAKLIRDIDWEDPRNYGTITKKLIDKFEKELIKQDMSDHELEYIQLKHTTGRVLRARDLSLHLSQDLIEKVLISLVNRSLVRQKVNGEPLIQASEIGTENMRDWNTP